MFKRFWAAAAVSAAVHLCVVLILREGTHPLLLEPLAAVELEMVYEPQPTPVAGEPLPKAMARAPKPSRAESARAGRNTTTPAADFSVTERTEGPAKSVDRLSTLRPSAGVPMPGIQLPDEDPNALFGTPVPNVITRTPVPTDPKAVEGRGGVKMFLADDGDIKGFVNPEAHVEGLGFAFDLTDEVMKKLGTNPYRFEQHRLAEATREERFCQRQKVKAENERQALFSLPGELAALWADTTLTPAERRKLLFERWDECREDKPDAGASGATAMRAAIETLIRTNLPYGSVHAYTPHELAALNARRSSAATFAPYARAGSSSATPDAGAG